MMRASAYKQWQPKGGKGQSEQSGNAVMLMSHGCKQTLPGASYQNPPGASISVSMVSVAAVVSMLVSAYTAGAVSVWAVIALPVAALLICAAAAPCKPATIVHQLSFGGLGGDLWTQASASGTSAYGAFQIKAMQALVDQLTQSTLF